MISRKGFALLLLCLVFLAGSDSWWSRRRRRRRTPPAPQPRDCTVSQWSGWSSCSHQCGNSGTSYRDRTKLTQEAHGGSCPYHLHETEACNRGYCPNGGTPRSGYCNCRPGYAGTCCEDDEDECATRRPCQHICRNTMGSYTCRCHSCYTKMGTKCYLRQCKIRNACYWYGTVNPSNPCQNCDSRYKYAWRNNNALSCNDGVACTRNDRCSNGRCTGTPFSCLSCEHCSNDACQVNPGYCTIVVNGVKTCFRHGYLRPGYPCQQCDSNNKHSWTNNNNLPCSDNSVKTKDDRCVNGACRGTPYTCLPCETQDGRGCPLKAGYCIIQHGGQKTCFADRNLKPGNPCQWCSPSTSVSKWSNREGVACDDSDQCTRADTCRGGQCAATPFKCNSHCQFCNGNSCSLKTGFGFVNGSCTCGIGESTWSPWSQWSQCSEFCNGNQTRNRTCLLCQETCSQPSDETRPCNSTACVVHFEGIGCYKDGRPRTFPKLLHNFRGGLDWNNMNKTVYRCSQHARYAGYEWFALQFFGECWSGEDAGKTYAKYGASKGCWEGVGKGGVNYVYKLKP